MRPLIYDIGLHKGEDSEFYLKKGFRVIGVDADPDHCEDARRRLSAWVDSGQMTILNVGISERPGKLTFFKSEKSDWGTLDEQWDRTNRAHGFGSKPVTVGCLTLADLVLEHGVPYFIKIDIEGMDQAALASLGGAPALPPYISIEMAYPRDPSFASARAELASLARLGYDRFKIVPQQDVDRQVPPRPAREGGYADHRFEFGSSGLFGEEAPGKWLTEPAALRQFARIMLRHFPEAPLYRRRRLYRFYVGLRKKLTGRPEYAYWYDIHAKRSGPA